MELPKRSSNAKQGDVYLRACSPLLIKNNEQPTMLDFCSRNESQHAIQENEGAQGSCGDSERPLIEKLQEVFPDASRDNLTVAAARHPGDINRATEFLLQNDANDDPESDIDDDVSLMDARHAYVAGTFENNIQELKHDSDHQILNIQRADLLRQCIRMLKQKRLNLTQSPDVNYVGEDGIDADGLKREFLTSLMSSIRDGEGSIALFEGEFPHLVPVHSTDAIASNLFFCIGQLIAYSVVHGGIGFTGLSPAAKSFLVHESIDTACEFLEMKDIADLALREMLEAILAADTDEELQSCANADGIATVLASSGFNNILTMKNKHKAIQDVVLNDVILKRKTELEQLRNGLNSPFRIVDFLKDHPNVPISVLLPSPDDIRYDSDDVKHKLRSVSQGSDAEKQAFDWLLQYLDEISQAKGNSNIQHNSNNV
eukprot:Seg209.2 transcript_id=Seg209.2/GoldUCD/mRNA.D3Y31 product="G2/M phase-specific E3 ubiquitin-protein ligase" protein_id=Seg209.2/GoldUCD/D3Y31